MTHDNAITIAGVRYPLATPPRGPEGERRARIGQSRRNIGGRGIIGDASRRTDPDLDQTIITDLRDGVGTKKYKVAQGVTSYRRGDWDTRFDGALVLRPGNTSRGTLPAALRNPIVHFEYLGETGADWLAWRYNGVAAYHTPGSPGSWTTIVNTDGDTIDSITAFARYRGYYLLAGVGAGFPLNKLHTSTNGTTWTRSTTTTVGRCLTVHDNKLFWVEDGDGRIQWSPDDPTAGFTNVKSSDTIRYARGEYPVQLVRWPWLGPEGPAVVLVTNHRLLGLNESTGSVGDLFLFRQLVAATNGTTTFGYPWLEVWPRTQDAYITQYNSSGASVGDQVIHLPVGVRVNDRLSPNRGGGLPQDELVTQTHAVAGDQWLFVGSVGRSGTTSTGGLWAVNDRGGWHRLKRDGASGCVGFGYYGGLLVYANQAGSVGEMAVPDTFDSPQFAVGRSYDTTVAQTLELAALDAGQEWRKVWTGVEIDSETSAGARGQDANTSVVVKYQLDGAAAVTLGTLTSASIFPARLPIASGRGAAGYDFVLLLDGSTTDSAKTPVVTKIAINSLPKPPRRAVYDCEIDLLDTPTDTPYGASPSARRDTLDALDASGDLVAVSWGADDDAVSLAAARVTGVARNDLDGGARYAVQIVAFDPQASG